MVSMKFTLLQKRNKKKSIVENGLLDLNTAAYYPHYDFLYQQVNGGNLKILDLGCGKGVLSQLLTSKLKEVYAFDVDPEKIKIARKKFPDVNFFYGRSGAKLPFPNAFFDAVVAAHVIEHVDNERKTIGEIARILKPNGILYIVSPYRGLLTIFDSGNIRYCFPLLHKCLYSLIFGKKQYKKAFGSSGKHDLYGDCSITRSEHHHYTQIEVERLLKGKFKILQWKKFSFLCPILLVVKGIGEKIFKHPNSILDRLVLADHGFEAGNLSYTFFVKARKSSLT